MRLKIKVKVLTGGCMPPIREVDDLGNENRLGFGSTGIK